MTLPADARHLMLNAISTNIVSERSELAAQETLLRKL